MTECEKVSLKNKELQKLNHELTHEKERISEKLDWLTCENQNLNDELKKIKSFIEKFTYSSKRLYMLLNEQKVLFNKTELGFKSQMKQKLLKNFFVRASSNHISNILYFCYEKIGHKSYTCDFKKLNESMVKMVWFQKKL